MDLFQSFRPGQIDPLYVVTGTVMSSSWAIATYTKPMGPAHHMAVLSHCTPNTPNSPSYHWKRTGNSQAQSKITRTVDATGERTKDQCLFLRGFLLTPSTQHTTNRGQYRVKSSDGKRASGVGEGPSTSSSGGIGGTGNQGSAHFAAGSSRGGGVSEGATPNPETGRGSESVTVTELPSFKATVVSVTEQDELHPTL
jgi:hypothetical protein